MEKSGNRIWREFTISQTVEASAQARPNIALIKYWGKRDLEYNLPASGSISITLDALWTRTGVRFDSALETDRLTVNDRAASTDRTSRFLDLLRTRAGITDRAHVISRNNFPTAAGLASSASGFAALAVAADSALHLDLDDASLSALARRGSGSAARSIFGGYVRMNAGSRDDGADAYAVQLRAADEWPLAVVVAVTTREAKKTGSTDGMHRSRLTSPFYSSWVDSAEEDLRTADDAIRSCDFDALGEAAEHNCLKMHAVMTTSRPSLLYWTGATVECLHRIRDLRESEGCGVFFTVDAGPQVKAVCRPSDTGRVADALAQVPGVVSVVTSGLGDGAQRIDDRP